MSRLSIFTLSWLSVLPLGAAETSVLKASTEPVTSAVSVSTEAPVATPVPSSSAVRGLHITAWSAGSAKYRERLHERLKRSVVNALVIDLKEYQGEVYVPGVGIAVQAGAYRNAIPDLKAWLQELRSRGIYTIGRIVVFRDNIYPRKNSAAAVKKVDGSLWEDRTGTTWLDAYNPESWRYNIVVAVAAARLGFDEIQFDYIRFPTDGNLKEMRFSRPYSRREASAALVSFLRQARQALRPLGVNLSIDLFGLTTSDNTGMGIGQLFGPMAEQVDFVSPMTYPSHYARGEYGIRVPNDEPYRVISMAVRDALKVLGPENKAKLRPWLQDFSLKGAGIRYRAPEVRAQIQACVDHGVDSWLIWNAASTYTWRAIEAPFTPAVAVSTSGADIPSLQRSTSSVEISSPVN